MEEDWRDEFAQCLVVAFMWADDQRAAAEAVVREFLQGGKPIFFYRAPAKHLGRIEWSALRWFILDRDNFTCAYCGESSDDLCADHVIPLSRGGTNHESNLVCACRPCNSSKSDLLLSEWRGRYR